MTEDGFETFVRAHVRALRLTAFRLAADESAAEQLLYAALATTWLRWSRLDHDLPAVRTVLVRTATARRPPWSAQHRHDDVPDVFTEVPLDELDEPTLVLGAVQQLSPRRRAIIALRVLEGVSAGEAGRLLGRAPETVESDLRLTLRDLGTLLHDIETPIHLGPHEDDPASPVDEERTAARVRTAFRAATAQLTRGHLADGDDLVDRVIARARRTRWQRRAGAVGAVAAVAVAAVVLPGALPDLVTEAVPDALGGAQTETEPATTASAPLPQPDSGGSLGPAPRVPHAENAYEIGGGYLYDGTARVRIPRGQRVLPFGRVKDGWLVVRGESHDYADGRPRRGRVGVLHADGGFVAYGVAAEWRAALSPDGGRAAFVTPIDTDNYSLVVVDLANGRRTTQGPAYTVLGWNPAGIWFRATGTYVWQPGTPVRPVRDAGRLEVYRDRSWVVERSDGCVTVAVLRPDGWLARRPRQCGDGVLSPTGEYVRLPAASLRAVPGADPSRIRMADAVTWEDRGHMLLHISTGDAFWIREVVARCHLATGDCELAYDKTVNSAAQRLTLHEP